MLSYFQNRSGDVLSIPTLQHIPLASAYLCQDCNSIGNCSRQCPACASEVLLGLSAVLNREVEPAHTMSEPSFSYMPAMVA
jgi:hypothetical protein